MSDEGIVVRVNNQPKSILPVSPKQIMDSLISHDSKDWTREHTLALLRIWTVPIDEVAIRDKDGKYLPFEKWDIYARLAIKSVTYENIFNLVTGMEEQRIKKVEFVDKMKAIELLGKSQGIWQERMDITSQGKSLADLVNESRTVDVKAEKVRNPGTWPADKGEEELL